MRLLSTGKVAKLWRVTPSRVRQILRVAVELAEKGEMQLPDGFQRTPGGHFRVPEDWARTRLAVRIGSIVRSTRNESGRTESA